MIRSGTFWLLLSAVVVVAVFGAAWVLFGTVNSPQPYTWSWSTVIAVAIAAGVIIGVIVGLKHRSRRE